MWNKYIIQTVPRPTSIKIINGKNRVVELILFQKYFPSLFRVSCKGEKGR